MAGRPGRYKGNKRDANERPIVDAFRKMGVPVERMDKPVDLLCLAPGDKVKLVEVKREGEVSDPRQIGQIKFLAEWPVVIVRSVDDVREVVAEWRAEAVNG